MRSPRSCPTAIPSPWWTASWTGRKASGPRASSASPSTSPFSRGTSLFGGIKNARFRRQVTPGDVLEIECTLTKQKGPVGIGEAKATVDGQVAATAELTFALVNAPEASACT